MPSPVTLDLSCPKKRGRIEVIWTMVEYLYHALNV